MKARPRNHQPRQHRFFSDGFTLLELMIVLVIMAIFLSVAALSFQGLSEEEILTRPADELQRVAREAVRRASIFEQPEVIVFDKRGFGIQYRGEADAAGQGGGNWVRHTELPNDMKMFLKHWGQTEWQPAAGQLWMVQPSGLCEPITVRIDRGQSFVEMQFNPLTGGVAQKRLVVPP